MVKCMRKVLCVLVIIFFSLRLSAQFEKGNYITGGSFQANFISPANSSVHNYHIAFDPRVGYYFMNGFASGVDLTAGVNKTTNNTSNEFGGGPFVRYHILKYFYTEISYQYVVNKANYSDTSKSSFTNTTVRENKY